jgi:glycosyltransferase involved in cell wall biosynthesis
LKFPIQLNQVGVSQKTPYNFLYDQNHGSESRRTRNVMISFIVPAHNEEFELSSTLAAIRAAAAGSNQRCEIIVVDDASTDGTPEIADQGGARVISIHRRQIAAARNAGARVAQGEHLFFVDADTQINQRHITEAIAALEAGYAGGSARVLMDGFVPLWGRVFLRAFSALYFGLNLGAGAFLFTTRHNFEAIGGFDEQHFAGEEVYFSLALRKLGRFKVLRTPILTSGRKLRMYSARQILGDLFAVIINRHRVARSGARLRLWYEGKREKHAAYE